MPGPSHVRAARALARLGEVLGFHVILEARVSRSPGYRPVHDVVWLLRAEALASDPLTRAPLLLVDDAYYLPVASFEVTGVDSSTKTVLAELEFSRRAGVAVSVIVVPNEPFDKSGKRTGMHFSRAVRVAKTYVAARPGHSVAVLSIDSVLEAVSECNRPVAPVLGLSRERPPRAWRGSTRRPRTDLVVYLVSPGLGACFSRLGWTSRDLGEVDLVGIEVERRTGHKHLAGSAFMLEAYYPLGVLAVRRGRAEEARRVVSALGGEGRIFVVETG